MERKKRERKEKCLEGKIEKDRKEERKKNITRRQRHIQKEGRRGGEKEKEHKKNCIRGN